MLAELGKRYTITVESDDHSGALVVHSANLVAALRAAAETPCDLWTPLHDLPQAEIDAIFDRFGIAPYPVIEAREQERVDG